MPNIEPQKIVYLFGAGATHAEKTLECKIKKVDYLKKKDELKLGLLAKEVSERVIKKLLKKEPEFLKNFGITEFSLYQNPLGAPCIDVELFISLLEAIKIDEVEEKAKKVRDYFRNDIYDNLFINGKLIHPRLYSALIELHNLIKDKEELIGFLTLNYDSIFEKSFKLTKNWFDYGLDVEKKSLYFPHKPSQIPLLKLHGSFDWHLSSNVDKIVISSDGKTETMQWIPPRLNKEYSNYPYNIIHGKAYELLAQCNILRVIGCSLNQNDIGLISLLFKTQHKGSDPYLIEIIDDEKRLQELIKRIGMLLSFDESFYRKGGWTELERNASKNHFLDWLYYQVENTSNIRLFRTKYLKNIKRWANL